MFIHGRECEHDRMPETDVRRSVEQLLTVDAPPGSAVCSAPVEICRAIEQQPEMLFAVNVVGPCSPAWHPTNSGHP